MVIKKSIVLTIVIALILSSLAFFFFDTGNENSPANKVEEFIKKYITPGNSNENNDGESQSSSGGGGGGSGEGSSDSSAGGGGGSGEGVGQSSGTSCSTIKISYALKKFNETINCQTYSNGNCVSLIATCSVEIYHLDKDSDPGEFIVRYNLAEIGTGDIKDTSLFSKTISYGNFEIFEPTFSLSDSNGINENLECDLIIESIPTKELCITL